MNTSKKASMFQNKAFSVLIWICEKNTKCVSVLKETGLKFSFFRLKDTKFTHDTELSVPFIAISKLI